jgi:transposase InsO family protein
VERIMREHGLQGAFLRRGWEGGSTTQNPRHTAAPDLVDRDFTATEPNRLWVADLTRIMTGEGVLWLASVRDAFSNKVVGWATAVRADTELVLSALGYALRSREVRDGQLVSRQSSRTNPDNQVSGKAGEPHVHNTTTVFSQRSMRRFGISPGRATPKGHNLHHLHSTASGSPTYIWLPSTLVAHTRSSRPLAAPLRPGPEGNNSNS